MDTDDDIGHEERGIYVVVLSASIPIVVGTALAHEDFDAGSTISLILLVLAVVGLFGRAIRSRNRDSGLPTARVTAQNDYDGR